MKTMTITYQIEFFSYWHTSSGLSAGNSASLLVLKDEDGLPMIKGRTLKGLIANAAHHISAHQPSLVSKHFIEKVFGKGDDEEKGVQAAQKGVAFFTNASLAEATAKRILSNQQSDFLYQTIAATAINKQGVAKSNSLRTTEVSIPLCLYAQIEAFPKEYETELKYCFQWIKRMGFHRHRGLGACQFSIIETT